MKDKLQQIKNSTENINSRISEAEKRISELEDTTCKNTEAESRKSN